ncbi:MAG: hypothetical protein ACKO03_03075, partial [Bacteroidota bacterium]
SDASTSSAIWARSAKLNIPRRTSKEESTKTKEKSMPNDQGPSPRSGTSYGGVSNGSSSGIQSGSSSATMALPGREEESVQDRVLREVLEEVSVSSSA